MTISSTLINKFKGYVSVGWNTALDSSDTEAKEVLGLVRYDFHPVFGLRGFKYVRFDQSGGNTAGELVAQVANVAISNITAGTTTSITTSGLTADIHVGGLLVCTDDAGGAGAAPEGEAGVIVANTATVVQIDPDSPFSAAPASNDDFVIVKPWATGDAVAGDVAVNVQGVAMADQAQYDYGWVQFLGLHPKVSCIAAGTALTTAKSLIMANGGLVTNGNSSAAELRVGYLEAAVASDQVARYALVNLFCGEAFKLGASA